MVRVATVQLYKIMSVRGGVFLGYMFLGDTKNMFHRWCDTGGVQIFRRTSSEGYMQVWCGVHICTGVLYYRVGRGTL